jgi:crotonobetaine/carnitine-CoA ligase
MAGAMVSMIAKMEDTPAMLRCRGQIRFVHAVPFSAADQRIWRERFGVRRPGSNSYGLTEASPLTTLALDQAAGPPGSSGRPNDVDFDVRIFDDQDQEVGAGVTGEIVCRPRRRGIMFGGYWNRPESFVEATRNLWFHTGDLGRIDEDGFFYFMDRQKDYLRRRGENISSRELEDTYLSHPDIAEVAVHAVASEFGDEDVKVTAVMRVGSGLTADGLFEWSKDRIPYYALPRYIEFRTALPRSPFGRIQKYQLRDEGCRPGTWDRDQESVTWERR